MPNKLLGQHFLRNPGVAQKILASVAPAKGELILEVGPGNGELTRPLAAICAERGNPFWAIEKDPLLAAALQKELAGRATILLGDILDFVRSGRLTEVVQGRSYKIVGNIPYYLTGHLLRLVGELEHKPETATLMIQKEVVERLTAQPPKMNRLAASVQFWATPKIICAVPKTDFNPPPKVDSAVLQLTNRISATAQIGIAGEKKYYAAVRALFAQPRKTVLNNLAEGQQSEQGTARSKEQLSLALRALNIEPTARPQNLSIENIIKIADLGITR